MTGKIKKLIPERGFGFITGEDGKDYFFHRTETIAFEDLYEGDQVSFEADTGPNAAKGPRALAVVVAEAVSR
jgi:cold shock protein